jgi:hypothetical protein
MTQMTKQTQVATTEVVSLSSINWIQLAGDYSAVEEFFELIKKLVLEASLAADSDAIHTTRKLCFESLWSALTLEEKKLAGRCMSKLVKTQSVPFALIKGNYKGSRKYRKI